MGVRGNASGVAICILCAVLPDEIFLKADRISKTGWNDTFLAKKNDFFGSKMWHVDGQGGFGGRRYANVVLEIKNIKIPLYELEQKF